MPVRCKILKWLTCAGCCVSSNEIEENSTLDKKLALHSSPPYRWLNKGAMGNSESSRQNFSFIPDECEKKIEPLNDLPSDPHGLPNCSQLTDESFFSMSTAHGDISIQNDVCAELEDPSQLSFSNIHASFLASMLSSKTSNLERSFQPLDSLLDAQRLSTHGPEYVAMCATFIISTLKLYGQCVPRDEQVSNDRSQLMFRVLNDLNELLTKMNYDLWHLPQIASRKLSCFNCELKQVVLKHASLQSSRSNDKFCLVCLVFVPKCDSISHALSDYHKNIRNQLMRQIYPHSCLKCHKKFCNEVDLQSHTCVPGPVENGNHEFDSLACLLCLIPFASEIDLHRHRTTSLEHGCRKEMAMELSLRRCQKSSCNFYATSKNDTSMQILQETNQAKENNCVPPTNINSGQYYCSPCSVNVPKANVVDHEAGSKHKKNCNAWVASSKKASQKSATTHNSTLEEISSETEVRSAIVKLQNWTEIAQQNGGKVNLLENIFEPKEPKKLSEMSERENIQNGKSNVQEEFHTPHGQEFMDKVGARLLQNVKLERSSEICEDKFKKECNVTTECLPSDDLKVLQNVTIKTVIDPFDVDQKFIEASKTSGLNLALADNCTSTENIINGYEVQMSVPESLTLASCNKVAKLNTLNPSFLQQQSSLSIKKGECEYEKATQDCFSSSAAHQAVKLLKEGNSEHKKWLIQQIFSLESEFLEMVSSNKYWCSLCKIECEEGGMIDHLLGSKHLKIPWAKRSRLQEKLDSMISFQSHDYYNFGFERVIKRIQGLIKEVERMNASIPKALGKRNLSDDEFQDGSVCEEASFQSNSEDAFVIGDDVSCSLQEQFRKICGDRECSDFAMECGTCGALFTVFNEDIDLSLELHINDDPQHSLAVARPVERDAQNMAEISKTPKSDEITKVGQQSTRCKVSVSKVPSNHKKSVIEKVLFLERKYIKSYPEKKYFCTLCSVLCNTESKIIHHLLLMHISQKWADDHSLEELQEKLKKIKALLHLKYASVATASAVSKITSLMMKKDTDMPTFYCELCQISVLTINKESHEGSKTHKNLNAKLGQKKSSVLFYCKICQITIHVNDKISHLNGMSHKKFEAESGQKNSPELFYCEICQISVHVNNKKGHMNGQTHKKLEAKLSQKKSPKYFCEICQILIHVHNKQSHENGKAHKKYKATVGQGL